jgi:hypothetical protein
LAVLRVTPNLLQFQAFGQIRRDRHIGRAGVEHEIHRLTVDLATGDEMPLAIARQFHFDNAFMLLGRDHHVRILLALFPLAEKPRGQKQRRAPGQNHQHPAGALARRLLTHGLALQPPSGAAKRQTIGRNSPSARAEIVVDADPRALRIHDQRFFQAKFCE